MKTFIFISAMFTTLSCFAQNTTVYGTSGGTQGNNCSFFGYGAGHSSSGTMSAYNTFLGAYAGYNTVPGDVNVGIGYNALNNNYSGSNNIAVGYLSMLGNSSGNENVAIGSYSIRSQSSGIANVAVGHRAHEWNTGNFNTFIGHQAGGLSYTYFSNSTAIGAGTVPTASDQVRIGNSSVTSIGGQVSWTTLSDNRFKLDIRDDVSGLEFIKMLRPVTYALNKSAFNKFVGLETENGIQSEPTERPARHTGFIAQEVEEIVKKSGYTFHGVDAPKNEKDYYGIRYEEFVVPLVKAVQELGTRSEQQQQTINSLLLLFAELNEQKDNRTINGSILHQNAPNPASSSTQIRMELPETITHATLMVYSIDGKELKSIVVPERGPTSVNLATGELPAGMYLYLLVTDGQISSAKRMILTR
jgi:trimeric autotransporter adhesin